MILDLKDIFADHKDRMQVSYSRDLLSDAGLYDKVSHVNIDADIINNSGIVSLILDVNFSYDTSCDRCAADLHRDYKNSFKHTLVSEGTDSKDDYIVLDNYNLNLDQVVRDDILLDKPSKILCKTDCKGLCPECGADLNYEKCSCKNYQVDPRLEVLKHFIDKNIDK